MQERRELRVIDSDGHFHEPHYLFDDFIDNEYCARRPRVVKIQDHTFEEGYFSAYDEQEDLRCLIRCSTKSFMYASTIPWNTEWERAHGTQGFGSCDQHGKNAIVADNASRFYNA